MTLKMISQSELATLAADLVASKTRVIAPVQLNGKTEQTKYAPIQRLEEAVLGRALPQLSLKEFFLPRTEVLLSYRLKNGDVEFGEVPTTFAPTVILGAWPCDAAGTEILDKVMGWDYKDELWFGRREATTVVTLACAGGDGSCFCTAVGIGPDSAKGSDVLLIPIDGGYLAKAITANGEALLEGAASRSARMQLRPRRNPSGKQLTTLSRRMCPWFLTSWPSGSPGTSSMSTSRRSRCVVMAAERVLRFAPHAIASTSSMRRAAPIRAFAAATGIPARHRSSRFTRRATTRATRRPSASASA